MQNNGASRKYLVAGNWKMNTTQQQAKDLVQALVDGLSANPSADVMVFPPYVYLDSVKGWLASSCVRFGAQNCAKTEQGAFTGEVSASMLQDMKCDAVIIGHSERRSLFGETDADVLEKTEQALNQGLTAVVCVGETLDQREGGQYASVIQEQLALLIENIDLEKWAGLVIAYEPVWAIGTGLTATPEQAQEVHQVIRDALCAVSPDVAQATRIIYGGSVNASNAAELFAKPDVDGGLVGGASLKADDFIAICNAVR